MTTVCAPRPDLLCFERPRTAAASPEGCRAEEWLQAINDPWGIQGDAAGTSLADRLGAAFIQASKAVQEQVRYLTPEDAGSLSEQVSEILSVDSWDDDDEVLKAGSIRTMVRLVIALGVGVGGLTIARNGNLVSTWSFDDHVLRVETHADGSLAWTTLHPRGAQPRHEHSPKDTIENLRIVLGELLGRAGGNPERR